MLPTAITRVTLHGGHRAIGPALAISRLSIRRLSYDHNAVSDGHKAAPGHRRKPARGGQNLTDRYKRLENSLRGKEAISEELSDLTRSNLATSPGANISASRKPGLMFRGFEILDEPKPPADDECCMSGCAICVYDLYEESMEAYREAVAKLQTSLSALAIPEHEWSPTIQRASDTGKQEGKKSPVLSAFEEMERALAQKKQTTLTAGGDSSNYLPIKYASKRFEVAKRTKDAPRNPILNELYETLRWVLFSSR